MRPALSTVTAALLLLVGAGSASAALVARFPVAAETRFPPSTRFVGPVLLTDGTVVWGRATTDAPGEAARRRFEIGQGERDQSPGWLLRTRSPGEAERSLAHAPFPVGDVPQELRLSTDGARILATLSVAPYEASDTAKESPAAQQQAQVGTAAGPLRDIVCADARTAIAPGLLATTGCQETAQVLASSATKQFMTAPPQEVNELVAGGGAIAWIASSVNATSASVAVWDPEAGEPRILADPTPAGYSVPSPLSMNHSRLLALRRYDPSDYRYVDELLSTDTAEATVFPPGREILDLGNSYVLLRDRTPGADRLVLRGGAATTDERLLGTFDAPGAELLGADLSETEIAWAVRRCDEILIYRQALTTAAIAPLSAPRCPTATLAGNGVVRFDRAGRLAIPLRCPRGCRGRIDITGFTLAYARGRVDLPARPGVQRATIKATPGSHARVRGFGRSKLRMRILLAATGTPIRKEVPIELRASRRR